MTGERRLWAGLDLLDRQVVDESGLLAGKVDDLDLDATEDGAFYVAAIVSGPGAVAERLGLHRLGRWLRSVHALVSAGKGDPARIPFSVVTDIDDHVTVLADRQELGAWSTERWFRDHVVAHIPGSGRAPE